MKAVTFLVVAMLIGLPSATESAAVEDLAWLAGCWASVGNEAGSGEQWMAPAGGTLLGVNRTVKNAKTVAYEFLQIRESAPGEIEFVANPSGQSETAFALVSLSGSRVVFENAAHDFPQRIIYHLKDGGALEARIEGKVEGQLRAVDFPFQRASCESVNFEP